MLFQKTKYVALFKQLFVNFSIAVVVFYLMGLMLFCNTAAVAATQDRTSFRFLKPHHVALSVPDLDAAVRWYVDKLDFEVINRYTLPEFSTEAAFLESNDFRVELFQRQNASPVAWSRQDPAVDLKMQGVKHFALTVSDLDVAVTELKNRDVSIVWQPTEDKNNSFRNFFIKDNNGNFIEIIE